MMPARPHPDRDDTTFSADEAASQLRLSGVRRSPATIRRWCQTIPGFGAQASKRGEWRVSPLALAVVWGLLKEGRRLTTAEFQRRAGDGLKAFRTFGKFYVESPEFRDQIHTGAWDTPISRWLDRQQQRDRQKQKQRTRPPDDLAEDEERQADEWEASDVLQH